MIYDTLDNSNCYVGLGERFADAFKFLKETNFFDMPTGRFELQGDDLYALVQRYSSKPREEGRWEAHRRYIDIQYIVSGQEIIQVAHLSQVQQGEYKPEKDFVALTGNGYDIKLFPTAFTIFYPQDAHMPGLAINEPEPVVKVVLKIKMAD